MVDLPIPDRPGWCYEGEDPGEEEDNEGMGTGGKEKGKAGKRKMGKRRELQREVSTHF